VQRRANSEALAPEERRNAWAPAAIAPSASPQLDALRGRAADARRRVDQLRRDPAPTTVKPEAPTVGTPAEEAAKDAAYQRRQDAAAHRRDQDRPGDHSRGVTPQRAPEL
jgi:hypothetical protein